MANMHLVTGYANKEHIKSADQGSFNAAMLGEGEFVLERGNKFASTIISNNIVRIKDGDILMQGRHIRLDDGSYIDLDFENGQQGFKRNDLIVVRYTKDSATGVEETNLVVIKGTPTAGNASDPEIVHGDIINDHVLVNDMPLYRVPFDGLNIQDLVCLFEVLPSWKTLKAQSVEETQTAIQKAAEQKLNQAISVIEEQMNEVVDEAEDAVARVPAVKQGTTDPTKTTVGILGQIYINTNSKKIFHCVSVASGVYTWVGDVLPELIVTTKKGVTVRHHDLFRSVERKGNFHCSELWQVDGFHDHQWHGHQEGCRCHRCETNSCSAWLSDDDGNHQPFEQQSCDMRFIRR